MTRDEAVARAVEHVRGVQARCGTRLVQLDLDVPVALPGGEVDVELLVQDILRAADGGDEGVGDGVA